MAKSKSPAEKIWKMKLDLYELLVELRERPDAEKLYPARGKLLEAADALVEAWKLAK